MMEQSGHGVGVGLDAGDVGGGREAPDAHRARLEIDELLLQVGEIDPAVGVFVDHHHIGDRLPPRQLVGVMLVGADKHHRPLVLRDLLEKAVTGVEVCRDADVQNIDQLVDRGGGSGAGENHHVLVRTSDRLLDDLPGVFPEAGGLETRSRGLGVGVGVEGKHLGDDELLDKAQGMARRRVVRIGDPPQAIRSVDRTIFTDQGVADRFEKMNTLVFHR